MKTQLLVNNSLTLTTVYPSQINNSDTNSSSKSCISTRIAAPSISTNRANTTKQVYGTLFTLLCAIVMILVPWRSAHAIDTAVKWHPGHYYTIMSFGKNQSWYMNQVYKELDRTPALRGLQIRYLWSELETSEGVYNFSSIDKRLAELAARGKRLVIQVQTKSFDTEWELVPNYLKAVQYEGGSFTFNLHGSTTPRGENIKLWNPLVRDRLIALFRALGKRYNSHPYFEGIGMIESAIGQAESPLTNTQVNEFYSNLQILHQNMRIHFPNTMTIQEVNYPREFIKPLVETFKQTATALSHPDTLLEEPGLIFKESKYSPQGVYAHYPELSGIIPLAPTVMHSNYVNTKLNRTGYEPTVSELLAFLRDQLKANYIFWTRDPDYYKKVLEMLNWSAQKRNIEGGLDPTCPSAYSSCIN